MKAQTRKSHALRQMQDTVARMHREFADSNKKFAHVVELWQNGLGKGEISQDAALRRMLLQEKRSLLDMVGDLTEALEKMYPDDQTTEEWLNHRYFEEWTEEEEEAEVCECGDFMKWEMDQPVDGFLETVDRIRDFVKHQKKG